MSAILDNVVPIFAMIAIGWAVVASGLMKAEVGDALGDFVFKVAVPVLLFRTIAEADFHGLSPWRLWITYFLGVAVTWTVGHMIATRLFGRDARVGVISGVSGAFANNVFIGLPLVSRFLDKPGVVALSILLSVHLPVMMIAGSLLMEQAERKVSGKASRGVAAILLQVGRNLVQNPLVIGLVIGTVFHVGGIPLTGFVKSIVDQLAAIAAPAALISIGMGVHRYGISGEIGLAGVMTAMKLLLLPATVLVASHLLGLSPTETAAMVLTSSVPTGINAWLIASRFGVGHGVAATTITLTTLVGLASVSFWVLILGV